MTRYHKDDLISQIEPGQWARFISGLKKVIEKDRPKYCQHFDCGWCYKENSKYAQTGCVGITKCDYLKEVK